MIQRVFIPVQVAGLDAGELIEFYTQPKYSGCSENFAGLAGAGLEPGIEKAKRLLKNFGLTTTCANIYCLNSQPPLINPDNTALGIMLISLTYPYCCRFLKVVVCADAGTEPLWKLVDSGFTQQKLSAVLSLGEQRSEMPLILSADAKLNHNAVKQLNAFKIKPYFFSDVAALLNLIIPN